MEAFADVLRNPAFDADRLKIALTAVTASIARQNDNPQGIVQREFTKTIQGADSPFGRTTPTPRSAPSRATTCWRGTRSTSIRTASSSASSATSPSTTRARS